MGVSTPVRAQVRRFEKRVGVAGQMAQHVPLRIRAAGSGLEAVVIGAFDEVVDEGGRVAHLGL